MPEPSLVSHRLVVLCERLAEATVAGDAKWRTAAEDTFVWDRPEGSVSIGSRDRDGEPPYELAEFNGDGVAVDGLVSQLVDGDRPAPWNPALADVYRVARRSALRADDLLDSLIGALPANAPEHGTAEQPTDG